MDGDIIKQEHTQTERQKDGPTDRHTGRAANVQTIIWKPTNAK